MKASSDLSCRLGLDCHVAYAGAKEEQQPYCPKKQISPDFALGEGRKDNQAE
jgi:hypothetical protein